MKKKFTIEVDCANCAAKIESAVKELPGVTNASISFMAQKMMLEADDDKFDAVLQEAVKVAKKVEPDFEIELEGQRLPLWLCRGAHCAPAGGYGIRPYEP